MFDRRTTMNRLVRVRFVRGCMCNGKPYAEGAEASLDPLEAGLLRGCGAAELLDPGDAQVLREAALREYRDAERRFKLQERGR